MKLFYSGHSFEFIATPSCVTWWWDADIKILKDFCIIIKHAYLLKLHKYKKDILPLLTSSALLLKTKFICIKWMNSFYLNLLFINFFFFCSSFQSPASTITPLYIWLTNLMLGSLKEFKKSSIISVNLDASLSLLRS